MLIAAHRHQRSSIVIIAVNIMMVVPASNEMAYDWDFAGGEAEFKKAFELDPNDATAHQWYAEQLATIGGREQEALAEINRAH